MYTVGAVQLLIQIQFTDDRLDQALLVVGIEDDEVLSHGQVFGFASQNSRTDRVERAKHHAFGRLLVQNGFDALVHFFGGFIGEGDGENLPWADAFVGDEVCNTLSEYTRLSGPRTCHDHYRPIRRCDRAALLRVEFVDEIQIHGADIINAPTRTVPRQSIHFGVY